ncbi:uncharacterized protein (DUF983 family) [Streptomyces glaucescens]
MTETRRCPRCGEHKPLDAFLPEGVNRVYHCKDCNRYAMRAYRAGMRKGKCATCGTGIEGLGVCSPCRDAMRQLGDTPEALRQATRALKWLME